MESRSEIRSLAALLALFLAIALLVAASSGCSSRSVAAEGWVHETVTDGNVTTVRTLRGSVWGGQGRLEEEASIGMAEGPDEYMFGGVRGIYSHAGQIYVLDMQVPALRVYDMEGSHLRDIGGKGEGPGEYTRPRSIAVNHLDGTVYLRDGTQGRLNLYTPEGEFLEMWPLMSGLSTGTQMVVTKNGQVYTPVYRLRSGMDLTRGMARMGADGALEDTLYGPDFDFEDWEVVAENEEGSVHIDYVPFSPRTMWEMCPDRSVVAGISDDYRFEIHHPDGAMTVVEMNWDKVQVEPGEARWYRARTTAELRTTLPGWAWNGKEVPGHKPAFASFIPDRSGRVWVRRQGPGIHLEGGDEDPEDSSDFYRNPCWKDTFTFDVFDLDGRFLGSVGIPDGLIPRPEPYVEDDMVIALIEDEDGVQYVKRYRLVLPSDGDE